jgi:hypothetical protein
MLLEDLGQDVVGMARLVQSQLSAALSAFFGRDVGLAHKVSEKDDQVDNLFGLSPVSPGRSRIVPGPVPPRHPSARYLSGVLVR